MRITSEEVAKLAHLARLEFKGEDLVKMQVDMDKILDFVAKIESLDLEGVEPLIYMNPEVDKLREDLAILNTAKEEAMKNAPGSDGDYFRVPRVLNG